MDKVQAYIQAIFGESSQSIAMPMFHTFYNCRPYSKWKEQDKIDEIVNLLKEMFAIYLVFISNNLIVHQNIFSKFENWAILGIVGAIVLFIIGTVGTLNYYEGVHSSELRRAELFNDNVRLNDSVRLLKIEINENNKLSPVLHVKK